MIRDGVSGLGALGIKVAGVLTGLIFAHASSMRGDGDWMGKRLVEEWVRLIGTADSIVEGWVLLVGSANCIVASEVSDVDLNPLSGWLVVCACGKGGCYSVIVRQYLTGFRNRVSPVKLAIQTSARWLGDRLGVVEDVNHVLRA